MKTRTRQTNSAEASVATGLAQGLEPTLEDIRQRAHEIYLARKGTPGNELEDWLRAEQQLKQERAAVKMDTIQPTMRATRFEGARQIAL